MAFARTQRANDFIAFHIAGRRKRIIAQIVLRRQPVAASGGVRFCRLERRAACGFATASRGSRPALS
jgi:hypothetical protein